MDNLTHSLAGALLGQMGLKKLTGRAMATLVIAANLPDIDAAATVLGTESLAVRRGLTHGPVALAILPLLLTGLVLLYNRWRPAAQPVRAGPLLLVAYIGALSHPALDWLNSYGIRLLEPFSSRWFAGDTLFIIDVWVWAALVSGFLVSRRLEKRGGNWQRPAWIGFTVIAAYVFANGLITGRAEAEAHAHLRTATLVVANPVPLRFWQRAILWRNGQVHGGGLYAVSEGAKFNKQPPTANNLDHPALAAVRRRKDVEAFLFWSRMPFVAEEGGRVLLKDQRFASSLRQLGGRTVGSYDPFTVVLSAPPPR